MALATSLTSARVGVAFSIIDSSIWVAVMTKRPLRRARRMMDFWMRGTFSKRRLDAQVAARHHDAVGDSRGSARCCPMPSGFSILAIIDDRPLAQTVAQLFHIAGIAHEGERHHVHAGIQAEMQVCQVLLRKGGDADLYAREVDALVVADGPAAYDFGAHGDAVGGDGAQLNRPVGQQNAVALLHVAREFGVSGESQRRGAQHLLGGDGELGARGQRAAAVFEAAQPDFRTLQVQQNTRVHARFRCDTAHRGNARGVVRRGAMRCVEPEYISPGEH